MMHRRTAARWCVLVAVAAVSCAAPGQREIVFASASGPIPEPGTVIDIFAMQPDGSGLRQLTHGAGTRRESNSPVWSPDGTQIAYSVVPRTYPVERLSLHVMDASGDSDRLLVQQDSLDVTYPEWSPDGRRLSFTAFTIDTTGTATSWIYMVNADGTMLTRLSRSATRSRTASPIACASWMPDGDTLLMSEAGSPGPSRILRIAVPSGDTRLVVESDTLALLCPVAAPDGSSVLLTAWPSQGPRSNVGYGMRIYRMDPDCGGLRPFVELAGFSKNARWSRDGRFVVFHGSDAPNFSDLPLSEVGDSLEIFTTDRSGGNKKQVTHNSRGDAHPGW